MSEILTLQVPTSGRAFDGDSLRCAAYRYAVDQGETGVCLVILQLSDGKTVQTVVSTSAKEASIVLPLPTKTFDLPFGSVIVFPCGTYLVTEQEAENVLSAAYESIPDAETICIVTLDRKKGTITASTYHSRDGLPVPLKRSAEAAAAAAMLLQRELENGTMESTIGQPGGILEIGQRKENGIVTGLSAGGPVEFNTL